MKDLRLRARRNARVALAAVLLAAVIALLAGEKAHLRLDFTESRMYTLSSATRSVLDRIDKPVHITAYVTHGLPQPYGRLEEQILDLLRLYHEYAGSKLTYRNVDPSQDSKAAQALVALNVPKIQVQAMTGDRAEIKQGYLAMVIEYLDDREIIPVVQSDTGLEYAVTSKIAKLLEKGRPKLGFVHVGSPAEQERYDAFRQIAEEEFAIVEIDPGKEPIPEGLHLLVIPGLKEPPKEAWVKAVTEFWQKGGALLILAGGVDVDLSQGFQAQGVDENVNAWLKGLGVAIEPGLVMDAQAGRITIQQRRGVFVFRNAVDYPFLPRAEIADKSWIVTRGLDAIYVPFASPIALYGNAKGKAVLRSSANAAVQNGPPFDIDPFVPVRKRLEGLHRRRVNLALAFDGDLQRGRMLVIGSRNMLDASFLDGANAVFILNALDWLVGKEDLILLRNRGAAVHPLPPLTDEAKAAWKAIWILGPVFIVVFYGLWRWRRMRKRAAA